ncbi:MAG: WD40 repeat domain-containing protein [Bacteroidota bacterium]
MNIRLLHTCTGHQGALYALAQDQNNQRFLSAGSDGWVVTWDLNDPENGRLVASVESQLFSLCHIPERQLIVAGNMNGGLHWIDLQMPENNRNIQHHQKGVYGLLAVENHLFSIGGDGILTRWSLESQRSIESYQLSNQALRCITFSPARRELAVGASDHSIYLLDADTLEIRYVIEAAHQQSVFTLCYTPDQKKLLSGGRDAMLRVWELGDSIRCVSEQAAHLFTLNHITFSPDQSLFATASRDRTIKIWDATSFELLKVIDTLRFGGHVNSVNHLLWTPDCLISCSDDRTIKLWEIG